MDLILHQPKLLQGFASGDPNLRNDEVNIRHLFGHGVLNLDARVHLDEHVPTLALACGIEQELHRAGVDVADRLRKRDRIAIHGIADLGVKIGRRGDLNHLLVATLHRAVTLEQVDGFAGRVSKDLHFDVAGPNDSLLNEHPRVTERAVGFAHGFFECGAEVVAMLNPTHATPTTTGNRLGEDRESDLVGSLDQSIEIIGRFR